MASTKSILPGLWADLPSPGSHGIAERVCGAVARTVSHAFSRLLTGRFDVERKMVGQMRLARSALRLEDWSDRQLQDAVQHCRNQGKGFPAGGLNTDQSVTVFAIVDESVRRRLGDWRFINETGNGAQSSLLDAIARSDLEAFLLATDADEAPDHWDSLKPAAFYRTLRGLDSAGEFSFIPTDEQLLAGLNLLKNRVVEMQAGEGKTVAIAFAAVMNAVLGRQVHIITANDYLASRDSTLLAPVYRALGFSVSAVLEPMEGSERKSAYECDIVYGTLREFGFDYLRDNLATRVEDRVQPELVSAIVDEADQALIDEGDTPLIISGPGAAVDHSWRRVNGAVAELVSMQSGLARQYLSRTEQYQPGSRNYSLLLCLAFLADPGNPEARSLTRRHPASFRRGMATFFPDGGDSPDETLVSELYFIADTERKYVTLTDRGLEFLQSRLGAFGPELVGSRGRTPGDTYLSRKETRQLDLACQVYQSLRAHLLLEAGVDYLVNEDTVTILDAYTGRVKRDNLYQDGLQTALEAKERLRVHPESETLAQISVHGFASRYRFLSGITGTAMVASEEFRRRFSLDPVSIPTSNSSYRVDLPGRIYCSDDDRIAAIVREVGQCHALGRPVLVGVQTIERSQEISEALDAAGIDHRILNAVSSQDEAEIIKKAGAFRAVTVATNMAGRGTDIVLDSDLHRRVVTQCVALVRQQLGSGSPAVSIYCNSAAEREILESAFKVLPDLQVRRHQHNNSLELWVLKEGTDPSTPESTGDSPSLSFGLGLHVISAEFSRFPRVSLQLKGRSGRQGHFGSTRQLLCWSDRGLLSLGRGIQDFKKCRKIDSCGQPYFEGKQVERFIRSKQQTEELQAANRRNIICDYAAVSDAHAESYRWMRKRVVENSLGWNRMPDLALEAANRLVHTNFPRMDLVEYQDQFNGLAHDVSDSYRIDISRLRGVALDRMTAELAIQIQSAVAILKEQLGEEASERLSRQLLLEVGDEAWREHQKMLRQTIFGAALGSHGHKSSVADYIIHAADSWEQFLGRVNDRFLSGFLTSPLELLDEELPDDLVDNGLSRELEKLIA